jgi:hypothetical protein
MLAPWLARKRLHHPHHPRNHALCAHHIDEVKRKMKKRTTAKSSRTSVRKKRRTWSAQVTEHSDALRLEPKVFTSTNPRRIAVSLKRSAETSKKRKGTPYQSAMSMLNFYINRAGAGLSGKQKNVLERAKPELRKAFGRA